MNRAVGMRAAAGCGGESGKRSATFWSVATVLVVGAAKFCFVQGPVSPKNGLLVWRSVCRDRQPPVKMGSSATAPSSQLVENHVE